MADAFAVTVRQLSSGRRRCDASKMQTARHSWLRWCMLLAILLAVPDFIAALKDVSVTIPQAVKRGSNALLICNYDMENDTLYSVKWYKGRREFYRYTPKENPAMKVFTLVTGLNVERNLSNQSHVVLLAVPLNISGKFTCEISVDAPTFQTAMMSGEMEVVELPEQQAIVTGIQPRYRIGDLVDGNCSIKFSKPAANLTWTINGIVVPPHHIKTYQIEKYEDNNLESVVSAIHFMVTTQHFVKGQMRLKCTASIFDIFKEEIESIIEEDRPRIMASGRSYDINNYPYEQHSSGDGFEDHNESYLTYYSAADITSAAAATTTTAAAWMQPLQKRWQRIWTSFICALTTDADYMLLMIATTTTAVPIATQQQYVKGDRASANDSSTISGNIRAVVCVVTVVVVVAVCAAVIVIQLTRHFRSCQNRKKAKETLNVEMQRVQQQQQQLAKVQATTTAAAAAANGAAKRKSFHNCPVKNAKSLEQLKGLLAAPTAHRTAATTTTTTTATNPLQKLQQQQQQPQQREQRVACKGPRPGKDARCHSVTNQNGSNAAAASATGASAAATAAAAATATARSALSQQLPVTLALARTAASDNNNNKAGVRNNKAIGNFVKDVSKDQTLLMMISLAADCECDNSAPASTPNRAATAATPVTPARAHC